MSTQTDEEIAKEKLEKIEDECRNTFQWIERFIKISNNYDTYRNRIACIEGYLIAHIRYVKTLR